MCVSINPEINSAVSSDVDSTALVLEAGSCHGGL